MPDPVNANASNGWFDDFPVLGKRTPSDIASILRSIGVDVPSPLTVVGEAEPMTAWWGAPKPYQHTSHAFGFIAPRAAGTVAQPIPIQNAGTIDADLSLRGSPVRVTLDRLRVFDYPGSGIHQVLINFSAQHHVDGQTEDVNFTQTYRIQQGEQAGIEGYPVFNGLRVGESGLAFKCYTVNVKNQSDEHALEFLDSKEFTSGLNLLKAFNPAVPVVSQFAFGLTRMLLKRNRNVPVQNIQLGLDFSTISTRARLAEGSYIAVQVPDVAAWKWLDWVFNPQNGQVVNAADVNAGIPYNYLVFSISRQPG